MHKIRKTLLAITLFAAALLLLAVVQLEGDDIINVRRLALASSVNYTDLPTSGTARRVVALEQTGFINTPYWGTGSRFIQMGGQPGYVLQRRFIADYADFQATTGPSNFGGTAFTVTDAAAATADTSNAGFYCRRLNTAASAGSTSSLTAAATSNSGTRRGYGPKFSIRLIGQSPSANHRYWVGMTSATLGSVDSSSTRHYAMFRYSTNVPDTQWNACTANGVTASCSTSDSWLPFPVSNTGHTLEIDCSDTATPACIFMVNGIPLEKTNNLPGAAVNLGRQVSVEALGAAARRLSFCNSQLETN